MSPLTIISLITSLPVSLPSTSSGTVCLRVGSVVGPVRLLLVALHLVYLPQVLLLHLTISLPVGSVVGPDDKAHVHVAPVIVHLNTYVSIRQHTSA